MIPLRSLQSQKIILIREIGQIEKHLVAIGGEEYRGCWLDSTQNRKGTHYSRLRWFKSVETKQKGCRTLKPDEVARAQDAIALWAQIEEKQSHLLWLAQKIQKVQSQIAQLSG